MTFLIDFDGTVIQSDSTDELLKRYASPSWEEIERRWQNGEISAQKCLTQQIELVKVDPVHLKLLIQELKIDPTFKRFIEIIRPYADVVILSDGLEYIIRHTLQYNAIYPIEVYANTLHLQSPDRLTLSFPYYQENCEIGAGTCKCHLAKRKKSPFYLIGDGKSDMCLAHKVDHVFAKGPLQDYCFEHHLPCSFIESFDDVLSILKTEFPFFSDIRPK